MATLETTNRGSVEKESQIEMREVGFINMALEADKATTLQMKKQQEEGREKEVRRETEDNKIGQANKEHQIESRLREERLKTGNISEGRYQRGPKQYFGAKASEWAPSETESDQSGDC